jgi:TonB family protein
MPGLMTKCVISLLVFCALCFGRVFAQSDTVLVELNDSVIYEFPEQIASFPGGEVEMMRYFSQNLTYPADAKEGGEHGRVVVQFIVENDGSLTDVMIHSDSNPTLDSVVVRAVRGMPLWVPAKQDGRNVRSRFFLPIQIHFTRNIHHSDP